MTVMLMLHQHHDDISLRSLKTHFVYGSLQEVIQQVTSLSQRAGTDHHRGVHRVQLVLQEDTDLCLTAH